MSTFKNKNLKCDRIKEDDKKSIHYDIVEEKHNQIMKKIDKERTNLTKYKKEFENIENELEKLSTDAGIQQYLIELADKELLTTSKISELVAKDDSEFEKSKKKGSKFVIVENEENITEKQMQILKQEKLLQRIQNKIQILNSIFNRSCHANELRERKDELEVIIYNIENNVDELNYYDNSFDSLHEYYTEDSNKKHTVKVNNLQDLFSQDVLDNKDFMQNRQTIADQYLLSISENKGRKKANIGKICVDCNIPKHLNIQEGILTCSSCGECEQITIDSDKPAYKDQIPDIKSNTYKRSNHCSELLNQSQGKESTDIEQSLLDDIINDLYISGITDMKTITKENIKTALTNLGKSGKAEHSVYIINKINGIPVDTIPHELNEIVKIMFSMAEEAWLIHKDPNRKNFMNTNYIFYKIFEMLEEYEMAQKWSLMSDGKVAEHDDLWEKICDHWKDRGWFFIPTL